MVVVKLRVEGGAALQRTVGVGDSLPAVRLGPSGSASADLQLPARGTLVIEVGYGSTEAEAERRPTSREEVHFRVVDGAVEVLLPTAKLVRVRVGDDLQWRRAVGLPDLAVELTPASRVP